MRRDWPYIVSVAVPALLALLFAHFAAFSIAQGIVFATASLLFVVWIFSRVGDLPWPAADSTMVRVIISAVFLTGALLAFFPGLLSGEPAIERPLSFGLSILMFLPYGISAVLDALCK